MPNKGSRTKISQSEEPAAEHRRARFQHAPDGAEEKAAADAFLARTAADPARLPSMLSIADGTTRTEALTHLQRMQGNAYVQRVVAELEAAGTHGKVVQRQRTSSASGGTKTTGVSDEELFQTLTISVVRDPLIEALKRGDGMGFLHRLRALSDDDRASLESDQSFLAALRHYLRGLSLWMARLVLRFGREQPAYVRELQFAASAHDAERVKDLLRAFSELLDDGVIPGVREMLDYEFRGMAQHAALMYLFGERELAWRTRDYSYQEAHYEIPEGKKQYEMMSFVGQAHYDISRTTSELRIVVRIRFVYPQAHEQYDKRKEAISAEERERRLVVENKYPLPDAKAAQWRNGIESSWNNRFTAFNGRTRLWVVFVPVFTDQDPHHEVAVFKGAGRSDEHHWYLSADGDTAAHEFGHMVGDPDEYQIPATKAEIPASMGLSEKEKQGSSVEGVKREQKPVRKGGYTLKGLMGEGEGAALPRHVWPVLDWYNKHMLLAGEPPYRRLE